MAYKKQRLSVRIKVHGLLRIFHSGKRVGKRRFQIENRRFSIAFLRGKLFVQQEISFKAEKGIIVGDSLENVFKISGRALIRRTPV